MYSTEQPTNAMIPVRSWCVLNIFLNLDIKPDLVHLIKRFLQTTFWKKKVSLNIILVFPSQHWQPYVTTVGKQVRVKHQELVL